MERKDIEQILLQEVTRAREAYERAKVEGVPNAKPMRARMNAIREFNEFVADRKIPSRLKGEGIPEHRDPKWISDDSQPAH